MLECVILNSCQVRLATDDETDRWDTLMDKHHYLGFKRFFQKGLKYIITYDGEWVGLAGWQYGALACGARDKWIGWDKETQYKNIRYNINNTRFCFLGSKGQYRNLGSWAFKRMFMRLSTDWEDLWGHPVYTAESFVDTSRFSGAMYKASGWIFVGRTKGYSRQSGKWRKAHGAFKDVYVKPLRKDALKIMKKKFE